MTDTATHEDTLALTPRQREMLDTYYCARDMSLLEESTRKEMTELSDKLNDKPEPPAWTGHVIEAGKRALDSDDKATRSVAYAAILGVRWLLDLRGEWGTNFMRLSRDTQTQLALAKVRDGAEYEQPGWSA